MMITVENITVYLGIITFSVGAVNYLIVQPLRNSILALQSSIDRLDARLSVLDQKIDDDRERLAIVEQSTKSAHNRIDRIDNFLDARGAVDATR